MGTRGAYGFYIDGTTKVSYNHMDSYPEGMLVRRNEPYRQWRVRLDVTPIRGGPLASYTWWWESDFELEPAVTPMTAEERLADTIERIRDTMERIQRGESPPNPPYPDA